MYIYKYIYTYILITIFQYGWSLGYFWIGIYIYRVGCWDAAPFTRRMDELRPLSGSKMDWAKATPTMDG